MPESDKIRILVVSPYEGLSEAVASAVSGMDGLSAAYVRGDLGEGVAAARGVMGRGFDVILSRGGTAELLEAAFPLPVVNVDVSGYDFVRVIKLVQENSGKAAIVGFSKITDGASVVCELLRSDLEIFTVGDEREVGLTVDRLMREGYSIIIGDNVTVTAARRRGMNGILVTSGKESVSKALDEAVRICAFLSAEKRRSSFLERALCASCPAGALTDAGEELVSWGAEDAPLSLAAGMAQSLSTGEAAKHIVKSGGRYWRAEAVSLGGGAALMTARPFTRASDGAPPGLSFKEGLSGETSPFSSFSANDEPFHSAIETAKAFAATDAPLHIRGAGGTGKAALAYAIHLAGPRGSETFVTADCAGMTDRSWDALVAADDCILGLLPAGTLFLKNLGHLPEKWAKTLLACLDGRGGILGWRALASSAAPGAAPGDGRADPAVIRRLFPFSIRLPELSERKEAIGDIASLLISEANNRYGKEVVALDPEALRLLAGFPWAGNIDELREVVTELVITSLSPYIRPEAAKEALERRRRAAGAEIAVSRGRTLAEIEADIIHRVLCEENGNQSKAAKRLGISRSTMWRKIRENG